MPGLSGAAGRAAGEQPRRGRSHDPHGAGAQLRDRGDGRSSRARTTITRTCRRAIRSPKYELPLCRNGWVEIELPDGGVKRIRIHRAHLEEDTGKNTHAGLHTLVDLNRAGMPLMEIVTEADIASADEAYAFLTKLRSILRYLGVNSGNMEEGGVALRAEYQRTHAGAGRAR